MQCAFLGICACVGLWFIARVINITLGVSVSPFGPFYDLNVRFQGLNGATLITLLSVKTLILFWLCNVKQLKHVLKLNLIF